MFDKKGVMTKVFSITLTVIIVGLLLIAGPADAFTLRLSSVPSVNIGETISFIASVDIASGERLPIDYLELDVGSRTCRFSPDGTAISGCNGLAIVQTGNSALENGTLGGEFDGTSYNFGYGYGYGFGGGTLEYNITVNSTEFGAGTFNTQLRAKMESGEEFESDDGEVKVLPKALTLNVYEPVAGAYDNRRVKFNVSTGKIAERIAYIDLNEPNPSERLLCRNCQEYGFTRSRTVGLLEGQNNLNFIAVDKNGARLQKSVNVFVDSRDPRIRKSLPASGFTDGEFQIEFEELNPTSVVLNYGNAAEGFRSKNIDISTCEHGRFYECNVSVDLYDYDSQTIEYSFEVTDVANNTDQSRKRSLKVDMGAPLINIFNYKQDGKRVEFAFSVYDPNFYRIRYLDLDDARQNEKTLCTSLVAGFCIKKISLGEGEHNISFNVTDKAGNSELMNFSIFIDSIDPRILEATPKRGSTDGNFYVRFKEENPESLVLHYGNAQKGLRTADVDLGSECRFNGRDHECNKYVDLSDFDGKAIAYWFTLEDVAGQTDETPIRELNVEL